MNSIYYLFASTSHSCDECDSNFPPYALAHLWHAPLDNTHISNALYLLNALWENFALPRLSYIHCTDHQGQSYRWTSCFCSQYSPMYRVFNFTYRVVPSCFRKSCWEVSDGCRRYCTKSPPMSAPNHYTQTAPGFRDVTSLRPLPPCSRPAAPRPLPS